MASSADAPPARDLESADGDVVPQLGPATPPRGVVRAEPEDAPLLEDLGPLTPPRGVERAEPDAPLLEDLGPVTPPRGVERGPPGAPDVVRVGRDDSPPPPPRRPAGRGLTCLVILGAMFVSNGMRALQRWFAEVQRAAQPGPPAPTRPAPEPAPDAPEHARARRELGMALEYGRSRAVHPEGAVACYRDAARAGDVDAMVRLAWCLERGHGAPRDLDEAHRLYQRACNQGHLLATARVFERMGSRDSHTYVQAAAAGDPIAMLWCATVGPDSTRESGRALLRRGAHLGEPTCVTALAADLAEGRCGPRDPVEARALALRAARLEEAGGMVLVAHLLLDATGGRADEAEAAAWARRAAQVGHGDGCVLAADLLEAGIGQPADARAAYELTARAAEAGHAGAIVSHALRLEAGRGVAPAPVAARELLRRAALAHDPEVSLALARALAAGVGGPVDDAGAASELLDVEKRGGSEWRNERAQLATANLALLALDGRLPDRDAARARRDLAAAAIRIDAPCLRAALAAVVQSDPRAPALERARAEVDLRRAALHGDGRAIAALVAALRDGRVPPRSAGELAAWELESRGVRSPHEGSRLCVWIRHPAEPPAAVRARALRLAAANDPVAMREAGLMALEGRGGSWDPSQGEAWLRRAAAAGDGAAYDRLAGLLEARGDATEARAFALEAAERGDRDGQARAARYLEVGLGGPVDAVAAVAWYRRAAALGQVDARWRVATLPVVSTPPADRPPRASGVAPVTSVAPPDAPPVVPSVAVAYAQALPAEVVVGARYRFHEGPRVVVWTVTAGDGARVTYLEDVFVDGRRLESREGTWTRAALPAGVAQERIVGRWAILCSIDETGSCRAKREGQEAFPGLVRTMRDGAVLRELVAVDVPRGPSPRPLSRAPTPAPQVAPPAAPSSTTPSLPAPDALAIGQRYRFIEHGPHLPFEVVWTITAIGSGTVSYRHETFDGHGTRLERLDEVWTQRPAPAGERRKEALAGRMFEVVALPPPYVSAIRWLRVEGDTEAFPGLLRAHGVKPRRTLIAIDAPAAPPRASPDLLSVGRGVARPRPPLIAASGTGEAHVPVRGQRYRFRCAAPEAVDVVWTIEGAPGSRTAIRDERFTQEGRRVVDRQRWWPEDGRRRRASTQERETLVVGGVTLTCFVTSTASGGQAWVACADGIESLPGTVREVDRDGAILWELVAMDSSAPEMPPRPASQNIPGVCMARVRRALPEIRPAAPAERATPHTPRVGQRYRFRRADVGLEELWVIREVDGAYSEVDIAFIRSDVVSGGARRLRPSPPRIDPRIEQRIVGDVMFECDVLPRPRHAGEVWRTPGIPEDILEVRNGRPTWELVAVGLEPAPDDLLIPVVVPAQPADSVRPAPPPAPGQRFRFAIGGADEVWFVSSVEGDRVGHYRQHLDGRGRPSHTTERVVLTDLADPPDHRVGLGTRERLVVGGNAFDCAVVDRPDGSRCWVRVIGGRPAFPGIIRRTGDPGLRLELVAFDEPPVDVR